jgi:NMT1-like family
VRIGYLPITDAPLLVAHHNKTYEAQGLTVEPPRMFRSWVQLVEAFISGQVNVVHLLSPITVWARYGSKVPAKVVAWNHVGGSALTVAPSINQIKDLAGKTVAVPFWYSMHNVVLQHLLREGGLEAVTKGEPSARQVKLVVMSPSDMTPALAPDRTFASLYQLLLGNELTLHILVSLRRALVDLLIALAIGASRPVEASTGMAFKFLRMISPLSWMPIAVMVLGVGDAPIYFLLAFAAVWPILLNTGRWHQTARPALDDAGPQSERDALGNPAPHCAAGRAQPYPDRPAAGDRHRLGRAGALRDAGCQRRPGLLHPGYARPPGLLRADGGDSPDRGAGFCPGWHRPYSAPPLDP